MSRKRDLYLLLKIKVTELNRHGLGFKLRPGLKDGNLLVHLEGQVVVDFTIEVSEDTKSLVTLIKNGRRYPRLVEDLISEMLFAADLGVNAKKYMPENWVGGVFKYLAVTPT